MNKTEFALALHEKLTFLPWYEVEEAIAFYAEIIDDRIEEGFSEEEAVSAVGTVEEIAAQIIADIPLSKIVKERIKPRRRLKAWEIVLLVLSSSIWLSLGIAAISVILSLYISLWSVIISLWSVFISLIVCSAGGVIAGIVFVCTSNTFPGIVTIGAGVVCAGLSIFLFYGCKAATKGILALTKKMAIWTKNCFIKKEVA